MTWTTFLDPMTADVRDCTELQTGAEIRFRGKSCLLLNSHMNYIKT
jgi:hypothetical protein